MSTRRPSQRLLKAIGRIDPSPILVKQPKRKDLLRAGRISFVCLEVFALIIAVPTAIVLIIDLDDRKEQRIAQAWAHVTTPAPGNSGKVEALEYLNSKSSCGFCIDVPGIELFKKQVILSGIDMSSERNKGEVYLGQVDLRGADLGSANLSGANIFLADLSNADLYEANLSNSNLSGAVLRNANLVLADFSSASLVHADLSDSNLSGANFSSTDFYGANLRGAILRGADLTAADFIGSRFQIRISNGYIVNLIGADLRFSQLDNVDLSYNNLSYVSIDYRDIMPKPPRLGPIVNDYDRVRLYWQFP